MYKQCFIQFWTLYDILFDVLFSFLSYIYYKKLLIFHFQFPPPSVPQAPGSSDLLSISLVPSTVMISFSFSCHHFVDSTIALVPQTVKRRHVSMTLIQYLLGLLPMNFLIKKKNLTYVLMGLVLLIKPKNGSDLNAVLT